VQKGKPWRETASVEDERFLIYSLPVVDEGQVSEIVQIGRSLKEQDEYLGTLRRNLLVGSGIATVFAFGIGWMLAGMTLRPIAHIAQTAQAIGADHDFGRRVEYAGPKDELGQLATTFNTMLGELQEAYQRVEGSLEMLRDFVADVSHELRTPLTTIRGNLALLRDRPLPVEEREDIFADTVDETERLIRLVGDLLRLARAEAGGQLQLRPLSVKPLILDVCRRARLLDPHRTLVCEPLVDVAAAADSDALQQVLLILLDNALEHAEGTITVTAQVRSGGSLDPSQSKVAIGVSDAGPGIDAETMSHLFERFHRGTGARGRPGLGLGLPIAKALVEAQNGTLTVESQPGEGSTFTVTLPATEAPLEALS
jgi:signal transduction histidine kinase